MRVYIALAIGLVCSMHPAAASAQVDRDTLDLKQIFNAKDSVAGVPVIDSLPNEINCPRFDPDRIRGDESTFSFERRPELERRMGPVEFTLEFVVGKNGKVERRFTRVIRTNNRALNRTFEYWVQSCVFKPGKIGEEAVRVRMEKSWSFTLNR